MPSVHMQLEIPGGCCSSENWNVEDTISAWNAEGRWPPTLDRAGHCFLEVNCDASSARRLPLLRRHKERVRELVRIGTARPRLGRACLVAVAGGFVRKVAQRRY